VNLRSIEKTILSNKELSDDQKAYLVKRINDFWDHHPDVTHRFPRWRKYIAWVAGYQLFDYNRLTKQLVEVPVNRSYKIIFNRLRPFVRTLLAKLTADTPNMSVLPNTDDISDVDAARIASNVVGGLAEKMRFIDTANDLKTWAVICNRAYLRVFWDEGSSGIVGYEKRPLGEEEEGPDIEEKAAGEEGLIEPTTVEGDVHIECVPPFNIRTDPLYHERSRWRWAMYGEEVDAEEVEEEYDLEKGSLSNEEDMAMRQAYSVDTREDQDLVIAAPVQNEDISGRTVVKKYFYTPNMIVIVAGKKLLRVQKNDDEEIPIYFVEDRIVPIDTYKREFQFNDSIIKDLIPVQREYNRIKSIESIAIDRASKLKVMTPLGSLLSKRQFVNDYGIFIDFNPRAGNPYQLKMDPFPAELNQYSAELQQEMEQIMNLSPASFGRLPERASHASGTLVNLLLEQDDVVVNPLLSRINNTISDAWSYALRLVQKNYTETRYIRYCGLDGAYQVAKFRGADLKGNTDVTVISQAGLPRSRALRIEYIMKLREVGLLKDDQTTLELLEFGNAEKIFKEELVHERKAHRENGKILDDPLAAPSMVSGWVYPLEDHGAHLKIHLQVRLGPEWEKLTEGQQQAFEIHIQEHNSVIAQQQAAMMQAAQEQAQGPANAASQTPETEPISQ